MKNCVAKLFTLPLLIVSLGLLQTGSVTAQTFTTIYTFSGTTIDAATNHDGAFPYAGLTLSGNTLYGTAWAGGANSFGTVFRVNTDGTSFTNLHSFTEPNGYINSDGSNPLSSLVLLSNSLYGVTEDGGSGSVGVVFKVATDRSSFTDMYNFSNFPSADFSLVFSCALTSSSNTLYGVNAYGGPGSAFTNGTVFKGNADGTGFTNLFSFAGAKHISRTVVTNNTGAFPVACLVAGSNIYGATVGGGSHGKGVIFKVNTDGTGFTNLYNFTTTAGSSSTNGDGAGPQSLILSGTNLYGDANGGGIFGSGTIFRLNTDGTGFTNLYNFSTAIGQGVIQTNGDGEYPQYGLILSGNTLYGTALFGGLWGSGTVFGINTDGTGFTNLHTFTATAYNSALLSTNSDGSSPYAGVILSGNTLYGTTQDGGTNGNGTIFSIVLPVASTPQLSVLRSGSNIIVTWPTNFPGITLQSTTNLALPSAWITNLTVPVVINTNNVVTNTFTGKQMFYRLSQ